MYLGLRKKHVVEKLELLLEWSEAGLSFGEQGHTHRPDSEAEYWMSNESDTVVGVWMVGDLAPESYQGGDRHALVVLRKGVGGLLEVSGQVEKCAEGGHGQGPSDST